VRFSADEGDVRCTYSALGLSESFLVASESLDLTGEKRRGREHRLWGGGKAPSRVRDARVPPGMPLSRTSLQFERNSTRAFRIHFVASRRDEVEDAPVHRRFILQIRGPKESRMNGWTDSTSMCVDLRVYHAHGSSPDAIPRGYRGVSVAQHPVATGRGTHLV